MKFFIIVSIIFIAVYWWMTFAALQEDDIDMLTQEELEELANELWERDE